MTIGPLVPLGFLGITFFVGSRPARRSPEDVTPELSRIASSRGETLPSAGDGTSREDSERDEEGGEKRTSSLFILRPSVRRVLRAGPGNHSSPDQVTLMALRRISFLSCLCLPISLLACCSTVAVNHPAVWMYSSIGEMHEKRRPIQPTLARAIRLTISRNSIGRSDFWAYDEGLSAHESGVRLALSRFDPTFVVEAETVLLTLSIRGLQSTSEVRRTCSFANLDIAFTGGAPHGSERFAHRIAEAGRYSFQVSRAQFVPLFSRRLAVPPSLRGL